MCVIIAMTFLTCMKKEKNLSRDYAQKRTSKKKGDEAMSIQIQMMCPLCRKRVLDIIKKSTGEIETKCIHCKRIIQIKLDIKK